jgi:hypothetical protein
MNEGSNTEQQFARNTGAGALELVSNIAIYRCF